jgi:hypothetical protein
MSSGTMMAFRTMVVSMLSVLSMMLVWFLRTSRTLGAKAAFFRAFRFIRAFRITLEVMRTVVTMSVTEFAERTSKGTSMARAEAREVFRARATTREAFRSGTTARETFRSGAELVLPEVERRRAVFTATEFAKVQAEGHAGNFDLEEGVLVFLGGFAGFTEIEIGADRALVSSASKRIGLATIASYARMKSLTIGISFEGRFRSLSSDFSEQLLVELSLELEAGFLAFKSFFFFRSELSLKLFKLFGDFSLFSFSEFTLDKLLGKFLSLLEFFTLVFISTPFVSLFRSRSSLFFFFVVLGARFNLLGINDLEIIRLVTGFRLSGSDVKLDGNSLSLGFSSNDLFVIMFVGNSDSVAVLINVLDTPGFREGVLE